MRRLRRLSHPSARRLQRRWARPRAHHTTVRVTTLSAAPGGSPHVAEPSRSGVTVNRILKPGGKFILSQSNRCFQSKAIAMWLAQSDMEHCLVIAAYFHYSKGWMRAKIFDASPSGPRTNDPLFIVEASKGSSEPPKLDASRWLKKK
eukprot:1458920-Prymnesium_polylepis.1